MLIKLVRLLVALTRVLLVVIGVSAQLVNPLICILVILFGAAFVVGYFAG
jgi:hypothetical protein